MQRHVVVFAKEPEPGATKTRLSPPLEPDEAVALYRAFVEDVVATARQVDAAVRTLAAPGEPGPFLRGVAPDFAHVEQVGADLGARMEHALRDAVTAGAKAVCLLGTDSPGLPVTLIEEAFARVEAGAQVVFGPATDGGYYLVAVGAVVPRVFEAIPWSTGDVLGHSLARASAEALQVHLLPFWYDVDDAADLKLLAAYLAWRRDQGEDPAPATAAALAALAAARKDFFPRV